jgi:hypothetical protein
MPINNRPSNPAGTSRRNFLTTGTGALVTGAMAASLGRAAAMAASDAPPPAASIPVSANPTLNVSSLPWAYKELDVALVRRRAYESYFKGSCCYAAANALLTTLKENSGGPWATIPPEMFRFGHGGALGWGTLCGALTASLAVLNLASAKYEDLGNELIGWYTLFPFPSSNHETYTKFPKQKTTVAHSPLCHISVGTWASKTGATMQAKEKKERCAKLTGDTAARVAELLNQALTGGLQLNYQPPKKAAECMECHQGARSPLDDVQGKFDCLKCHDAHPLDK